MMMTTSQSHRSLTLPSWLVAAVLWCAQAAASSAVPPHTPLTFSASAPHQFYSCPEGGTAMLQCSLSGVASDPKDKLKLLWLFTPHSDQHCHNNKVRQTAGDSHPHGNHSSFPPGVDYGMEKESYWLQLQNLVPSDQGRYCCVMLDLPADHKHAIQQSRSHVVLQVTPKRNGSQACTIWDTNPPGASVSAIVATVACIMALLSLPLILVLVYKQRQSASASRRAHELVRMDSEAQGHENPVFHAGPPQGRTRTVSQIMTRQSSDTGRHLLSEPGTPLSPPARGEVFFPANDTIAESPDFLSV